MAFPDGEVIRWEDDLTMWAPDHYLQVLYKRASREFAFPAGEPERLAAWREGLRTRLNSLIGSQEDVEQRPASRVLEETDCGDYVRLRIEYDVEEQLRVPAYVLIPAAEAFRSKRPAIVACHGHGYGGRAAIGLRPDGTQRTEEPEYHGDFALELVRRGFIVIVPELIGFGDTRMAEHRSEPPQVSSCVRLSSALLLYGKTTIGLRVRQMRQAISYLAGREDVDANRIGCMGISGGGMVCTFAAALDDRLRASVVSGYVSTFAGSILAMHHCIDNFVPGLLETAELPDIVSLIAPRPLLIEAGTEDHIFPIDSVKEAYAQISAAYELHRASDRLASDFFAGGHVISGRVAYDWLVDQLKADVIFD